MYLLVDIGGSSIKIANSDINGNLQDKETLKFNDDFENIVKVILDYKNRFNYDYQGIAFSVPGAVDTVSGVIGGCSALTSIHGPNFKETFNSLTGLNISLDNDANCAALAECFNGSSKDNQNILSVVIGSGIGGSVIYNSKIAPSTNLYGGEFGYMLMTFDDFDNLETVSDKCSTVNLVSRVNKLLNTNYTGEEVFMLNNEVARNEIDKFYNNLAILLYNLTHSFDPELIVIGGAISTREDFIDILKQKLNVLVEKLKTKDLNALVPKIAACTHKSDANLIGALNHHLNEYK